MPSGRARPSPFGKADKLLVEDLQTSVVFKAAVVVRVQTSSIQRPRSEAELGAV